MESLGLKDAARLSQIRLGLRWALMGSGGGSNGGAFHIGTAMRHILPMCIVVNRCAYPHIFANISVYSRIIRIIPHLPHHYAFVASAFQLKIGWWDTPFLPRKGSGGAQRWCRQLSEMRRWETPLAPQGRTNRLHAYHFYNWRWGLIQKLRLTFAPKLKNWPKKEEEEKWNKGLVAIIISPDTTLALKQCNWYGL